MSDSFREAYGRVRHSLGLDPDETYPVDASPDAGGHVHVLGSGAAEAPADEPRPIAPPDAPSAAGPDDDEHRAVLEVLVATMYADSTITEQELDEIDRYGDEHQWNTPTFSFVQGMAVAAAKVRDAREADGGLDDLLAGAAARITTPAVRRTLTEACRHLAQADGATVDTESAWIAKVRAAFGG